MSDVSYMFGEDVAKAMSGNAPATAAVDRDRYEELLEKEAWLDALEAAGVDNWDGVDFAQEIFGTFNQTG